MGMADEAREVLCGALRNGFCRQECAELEELLLKIDHRKQGKSVAQKSDAFDSSTTNACISVPDVASFLALASNLEFNARVLNIQIVAVNREVMTLREQNNDQGYHILFKREDGHTTASQLPAHATIEDLRELAAACCWTHDIAAAVHLNGQQVTNIKQPLSAYGLMGSQCLVVVDEVSHMKLKGGMEK